ncbi:LuxR family transcriptional regulator [Kitasatospora nipponensis]|uniref:LuxR family transcriptional regulator n=1 Tax=Kitasatospora nipponensis TaxID=258049 RepID=A0ABP4GN08_9ACTN
MAAALNHAATGTFHFVGRQRELDLLLAAVHHPPAVVLVEGEAGIGKSRLICEAARILTADGLRVLMGSCHPLREPFPYGPVADALRKGAHWLPTDSLPPITGALASLLPDLADRLPVPPVYQEDPRTARHLLVQAVRSFLAAIGPAVLVIEDMHWVDEGTRDLLLLLARDLPDQLGLIVTYRAENLPPDTPVLGAAYRRPPGTSGATIRLAPLSKVDVHALADAALGDGATSALAAVLYDRSQGLPLVAEEDLITLCEHGLVGNPVEATADLAHAEVPAGLREAVVERLAALSPTAAAVVDAAAILAVPAAEPLISAVAGLTPEHGAQGLTEALQAAVLRESGSGQYQFRHVLAQQVAYWHVHGPRRTRLHLQAREALQKQSPVPLVQIAHHTLAVGDRQAWLEQVEEAADQAVALGDVGTAASLLQQVLEEPHLSSDARSRAALALGLIAVNGADWATNAAVLRRILADPQLSVPTCGEIRLALGLLMVNHAGDRAGYEEIEQSIEELRSTPQRAARAMIAMAVNERDDAADRGGAWIDRADSTLGPHADDVSRATLHATRLTILARSGDPAVWAHLDQLPRRSGRIEILQQTTRALYNVGEIAIELGHDHRAAALLTESRDLAKRATIGYLESYSQIALLRLDGLAGHWAHLEERFAELGMEYVGMAMTANEQNLAAGLFAASQGRFAPALRHFKAAAAYGECEGQVTSALRAAAGLVSVRLAQGAPHDAWAIAEPATAILRQARAWARATGLLPGAVEAALACDDAHAAGALIDDAAEGLHDRDAPAAVAELHLARGLFHRKAEPALAAEDLLRAREAWAAIGRPYEGARAAEHLGQALARAHADGAGQRLCEAIDVYTDLNATADAARCQHYLREFGLARPGARGRHSYGTSLSPREQQVAELLVQQATNQEIAQRLFLSPRTIEQHVAHVLKKLNTTRKDIANAYPPRDPSPPDQRPPVR